MKKSWIVYGPPASGKTRNAKAIAAHLGLSRIVDEWDGKSRSFVANNTLHLTNETTAAAHSRRSMSIAEALSKLKEKSR